MAIWNGKLICDKTDRAWKTLGKRYCRGALVNTNRWGCGWRMQQSQANVYVYEEEQKGIANRDRLTVCAITAYGEGREDSIDSVPGTWTCNCRDEVLVSAGALASLYKPHPLPRATGPAGIWAISCFRLSICEMGQYYTCASFDLFSDEVPLKSNL